MSTATPSLPQVKPSTARLSSVLLVDRIEPCLEFWVDRLGFEVRLQIADEAGLEFVTLGLGAAELSYRTRASLHLDAPGLVEGEGHQPWVVIYLEVDDLDALLPRLEGIETVIPVRETILGGREVFLREPSGRILALTSGV